MKTVHTSTLQQLQQTDTLELSVIHGLQQQKAHTKSLPPLKAMHLMVAHQQQHMSQLVLHHQHQVQ